MFVLANECSPLVCGSTVCCRILLSAELNTQRKTNYYRESHTLCQSISYYCVCQFNWLTLIIKHNLVVEYIYILPMCMYHGGTMCSSCSSKEIT